MSYQVLARKWRPRRFEEMVGQEHVLKAIINALDHDRLHHAYLFTGTRGVGKTTIARIFSKSLNCEQGISSKPCGVCSTCKEIDEGRFVDLLEVDAASRTKVEDTRELLENVQYTPTRGRYKVYLIDEVHMLSNHSFNALLKTLEEPPPHVKFLLATTDPQRLPVTILSRCLQFNLKRLPLEMISAHLNYVLGQEGIAAEQGAVALIARGADGSMRDALSLLDQGIAHSGGELHEADIRAMLGTIDRDYVYTVIEALIGKDPQAVLNAVRVIAEQVPDFNYVLGELLSLLHAIAVRQLVADKIDTVDIDESRLANYAQRLNCADVQLFYQIGLMGRRDMSLAPDPRTGFEMTLLRMLVFIPASGNGQEKAAPTTAPATQRPDKPSPVQTKPIAQAAPPAQATEQRAPVAPPSRSLPEDATWSQMVAAMRLEGLVRQLAANCALTARTENRIQLTLADSHSSLYNKKLEDRLHQALKELLGKPVVLEIIVGSVVSETPAVQERRQAEDKLDAAKQSIEKDSNIQALKDAFNARVIPESIRPVD
jgi:DNA polymerase-3 subunit gamma/tau